MLIDFFVYLGLILLYLFYVNRINRISDHGGCTLVLALVMVFLTIGTTSLVYRVGFRLFNYFTTNDFFSVVWFPLLLCIVFAKAWQDGQYTG